MLVSLPHSRTMECEADEIGLTLLADACYDPTKALEAFARLSVVVGSASSSLSYLSSHPSFPDRLERVEKLLPKALERYHARSCPEFCRQLAESRRGVVRMSLV